MTRFHIVGLDLSLTATGVTIIRPHDEKPISIREVQSSGVPNAGYPDHLARIRTLCRRIVETATATAEDGDTILFAMEGPAFAATTGYQHERSGLWYLVYHLLSKQGPFVIIEPTRLKRYVTGKGNAKKDVVLTTVVRNFPALPILTNNEADSLALACMLARELGFPQEPSIQRVTPAALEGVAWPSFVTTQKRSPTA